MKQSSPNTTSPSSEKPLNSPVEGDIGSAGDAVSESLFERPSDSELTNLALQSSVSAKASAVPVVAGQEFGGRRDGPEPTRFGDWEKAGRCIDF